MNEEPPSSRTTSSTPSSTDTGTHGTGDSKSDKPVSRIGLVDRLMGWMKPSNGSDLRGDLEDALASDQGRDSNFSPQERAMLRNILRLRETRTEDVMIPRADIIAVDHTTSLGLVLARLRTSGHSRMPVFDGSLDQPIGLIHIKDVVSYLIDKASTGPGSQRAKAGEKARQKARAGDLVPDESTVEAAAVAGFDLRRIDLETRLCDVAIVRKLLFVPASMSATDLMAQMQANRVQMALVIDEYGGTDGLISLEDLIETVVGDIEDEHDDEIAPSLVAIGDGGFLADARVPIEEVSEVFAEHFTIDEEEPPDRIPLSC